MINWHPVCVALLACCAMLSIGGCASVTTGSEQSLRFDTEPAGADCTVNQASVPVGKFKTPFDFVVHRSIGPLLLSCTKPGFHEVRAAIASTTSVGAWGNILIGGPIGIMIDQSSGAAFRYYDPPKFVMVAAGQVPPDVSSSPSPGVTLLPPESPEAAVATTASVAPPPSATPSRTVSSSAPSTLAEQAPAKVIASSGPFDGDYTGGMEFSRGDIRDITIHVMGDKASGVATLAQCPTPGMIELNLNGNGSITGEANLMSGSECTSKKALVTGHADGNRLLLTFVIPNGRTTREFAFARKSTSTAQNN